MRSPRTPGAGITGAATNSLGSGVEQLIPDPVSRRKQFAAALDREADHLLALGRHIVAERLAFRAADIRAGMAQ